MIQENLVNHIFVVIDESGSMQPHAAAVVKAVDALVAQLAEDSKKLDQETRISVYSFANQVKCLVWDKDVLRLPSIATWYRPDGGTALINATMIALDDAGLITQKYGNHSFLVCILTDGDENASRMFTPAQLAAKMAGLPDHWTVAAMVPNAAGKHRAKQFGFPAGNIEIWDVTSERGVEEAGEVMAASASSYMQSRASGTRGTKNLFNMNTAAVNTAAVKALNVAPLTRGKFKLIPVTASGGKDVKIVLKEFLNKDCGLEFRLGQNFYQLSKPEDIQADKEVALVRKQDAAARKAGAPLEVYVGYEVRDFLGLPSHKVRVGPQAHPEFDIFVQSNSNNRHLVFGTQLLVLNPKAM